jgi:hypothetical protein
LPVPGVSTFDARPDGVFVASAGAAATSAGAGCEPGADDATGGVAEGVDAEVLVLVVVEAESLLQARTKTKPSSSRDRIGAAVYTTLCALHGIGVRCVERSMRASFAAVSLAAVLVSSPSFADIRRLDGLIVMTPAPTQAPPPGLRLRTMVRPADRLWMGVDPPAFVPLAEGELRLDLLDKTESGGWVATYRERYEACAKRGDTATCKTTVKAFDSKGTETLSIALDPFIAKERVEVQDVRFVEEGGKPTLYFNEACQSYSRESKGKCSSLLAFDPVAKKVLWKTPSLSSNNEFVVIGKYIVTAYGFTGEPASIRVVRRSDGAILDVKRLASANFEMKREGDLLGVELYYDIGRANFRLAGFDGDAPKLVTLPTTPPDRNDKPKPYDPPLFSTSLPRVGPPFAR